MKLEKLTLCQDGGCANVYRADNGDLVFQGTVIAPTEGLILSEGEQAVALPLSVVIEAIQHFLPEDFNVSEFEAKFTQSPALELA